MSAPVDVLTALRKGARYPKPNSETGEDTGPCCAHAYTEGWNDCINSLTETRAAVAELMRDARSVCAVGSETTLRMAIKNLNRSLARCEGGTP